MASCESTPGMSTTISTLESSSLPIPSATAVTYIALINKNLVETKSVRVRQLVAEAANLKLLQKPSLDGLKILLHRLCEVMKELKRISKWSTKWDRVLLHLAYWKLDEFTLKKWSYHCRQSPTFEKLVNLLQKVIVSKTYVTSYSLEHGIFSGKYLDLSFIRKNLEQANSVEVRDLVQEVLNLRRMRFVTKDGVLALLDGVNKVMQELQNIGKWTSDWDNVLVHISVCNIGAIYRNYWLSYTNNSLTFDAFLEFLRQLVSNFDEYSALKETYSSR